MKAITGWNFRPYSPMPQEERSFSPYICRLAPREGGFTADFIDNGAPDSRHVFHPVFGTPDTDKAVIENALRRLEFFVKVLAPDAEIESRII